MLYISNKSYEITLLPKSILFDMREFVGKLWYVTWTIKHSFPSTSIPLLPVQIEKSRSRWHPQATKNKTCIFFIFLQCNRLHLSDMFARLISFRMERIWANMIKLICIKLNSKHKIRNNNFKTTRIVSSLLLSYFLRNRLFIPCLMM